MTPIFQESYITTNDGLRLYLRDYGCSNFSSVPVICLPGITRNSKDFQKIATRLSKNRRVICPDLRGRGKSDYDDKPKNYWRPEVFSSDVLSILAAKNLKKAIFIGTSLGGLLAMQIAVVQPAAIAGIVLNDIGPELPIQAMDRIVDQSSKIKSFATWQEAISYYRDQYRNAHPKISDERWSEITKSTYVEKKNLIVTDYDIHIFKEIDRETLSINLWQLYEALEKIPTIVIRGELSDVLTVETFEKMRKRKPDIIQVEIPNCGHNPFLNEVEATSVIDKFVQKIDESIY